MKIYLKLCLKNNLCLRKFIAIHLLTRPASANLSCRQSCPCIFKCGQKKKKSYACHLIISLVVLTTTEMKCHESFVHLLIALIPGWTPQPRNFVNEIKEIWFGVQNAACLMAYAVSLVCFELCSMANALLLLIQYVQSGYQMQSGRRRKKMRCVLPHIFRDYLFWN